MPRKTYVAKIQEAFLVKKEDGENNVRYLLSGLINYSDVFRDLDEAIAYGEECQRTKLFRQPLFICEVKQVNGYYRIKELVEIPSVPMTY